MYRIKEIGIIPWGHRYKIKQAIEELQEKVVPNETVEDLVETRWRRQKQQQKRFPETRQKRFPEMKFL